MAATAFGTGFKIATANIAGDRQDYEVTLNPAPSRVVYPTEAVGQTVETADGRVVVQQPTRDPRRRSWVWVGYSTHITTYERQYRWLEGLRSRVRQNGVGLGSFVYVYDGTTGMLNRRRTLTLTVSAQTGQTLTVEDFGETVHPTTVRNATVDVIPDVSPVAADYDRYSVLYSTGVTHLYVDREPASSLVGRDIILSWTEPAWWKARVVEVGRTVDDNSGAMKFSETRFSFVIEDANWTELG